VIEGFLNNSLLERPEFPTKFSRWKLK